ncbi:MAG: hypothetical protein AAF628_37790 [Planctomycetota bacterium]
MSPTRSNIGRPPKSPGATGWIAPVALLAGLLGLPSCGEAPVAGLRLALAADLSGTVSAASLTAPATADGLENAVLNVTWEERATLSCARGTFSNVADLRLADLSFAAGTTEAGFAYVRVELPRGADAGWLTTLLPRPDERAAAQRAFDPNGDLRSATTTVGLEIEVPGEVMGNQVTPSPRGGGAATEGRRCTLVLPAREMERAGAPLTWLVSWRNP